MAPGRDNAIFGAFDGQDLVGTVGLHRERGLKLAHKAVIWGVYVAPSFRQRGVGRLLRRIERERRSWARHFVDEVPTEQAWRAGVAEGLRLAQVAIRKGV